LTKQAIKEAVYNTEKYWNCVIGIDTVEFMISTETLTEIFYARVYKMGRGEQELLKVFALPLQAVEFVRNRMT
jgi:hypothetical protein